MSNLTLLQTSLSKSKKQMKNASIISPLIKNYSMNQCPSLTIDYHKLVTDEG